jgi:hypothetical protein
MSNRVEGAGKTGEERGREQRALVNGGETHSLSREQEGWKNEEYKGKGPR